MNEAVADQVVRGLGACTRADGSPKRGYRTRAAARAARHRLRCKVGARQLRVYPCRDCGYYHLGNNAAVA